jgi:hypothetical protein
MAVRMTTSARQISYRRRTSLGETLLLTGVFLISCEELGDLVANLAIRHLHVVLGLAVVSHEGEIAIVRNIELQGFVSDCNQTQDAVVLVECKTHKLVLPARDVGNIHVVSGGREILELLASEDVQSHQMNLGVTVLARLGGRHVDDLARAVLDHNKAVLAQGRALHRVGGRRAGVGRLEGVFMLQEGTCQKWLFCPKVSHRVREAFASKSFALCKTACARTRCRRS